jgi:hypothetical protein
LPTTPQHRAKAENNEFLTTELDNPFWDWAVTANFYAALHYVEAYFGSRKPPLHPATHQLRGSHIHADAQLSAIYVDYRQLEDESRDARYDASMTFVQADVARTRTYLERIKAVVVPLLP